MMMFSRCWDTSVTWSSLQTRDRAWRVRSRGATASLRHPMSFPGWRGHDWRLPACDQLSTSWPSPSPFSLSPTLFHNNHQTSDTKSNSLPLTHQTNSKNVCTRRRRCREGELSGSTAWVQETLANPLAQEDYADKGNPQHPARWSTEWRLLIYDTNTGLDAIEKKVGAQTGHQMDPNKVKQTASASVKLTPRSPRLTKYRHRCAAPTRRSPVCQHCPAEPTLIRRLWLIGGDYRQGSRHVREGHREECTGQGVELRGRA